MTLLPPTWRNGPKICPETLLPALETEGALKAFLAANGPSCKVKRTGKCKVCGHWHAKTSAPSPGLSERS